MKKYTIEIVPTSHSDKWTGPIENDAKIIYNNKHGNKILMILSIGKRWK